MQLLPRDEKFFELFTAVATLGVDAANKLGELFAGPAAQRARLVDDIKALEHEADTLTHSVVARLDRSFVTPLDREDIHLLASRLDDVIDRIDAIARRTRIFRVHEVPHGAVLMAEVIHRATLQLLEAVKFMAARKQDPVLAACREVKRLEEEGDLLYTEWVGRLFEDGADAIEVLKWKELFDSLEKTLDTAEDVSNVVESVTLKHG